MRMGSKLEPSGGGGASYYTRRANPLRRWRRPQHEQIRTEAGGKPVLEPCRLKTSSSRCGQQACWDGMAASIPNQGVMDDGGRLPFRKLSRDIRSWCCPRYQTCCLEAVDAAVAIVLEMARVRYRFGQHANIHAAVLVGLVLRPMLHIPLPLDNGPLRSAAGAGADGDQHLMLRSEERQPGSGAAPLASRMRPQPVLGLRTAACLDKPPQGTRMGLGLRVETLRDSLYL